MECKQAIALEDRASRAEYEARRRKERRCFWTRPWGHRYNPEVVGQWTKWCRCCGKAKSVDWAW